MLREFLLRNGGDLHPLIKQDRAAGSGALINRQNILHHALDKISTLLS